MLLLFTDFGEQGPYLGELHLAIARADPGIRAIDLQHDAPACNPRASAHLLAALAGRLTEDDVVLSIVDPGVGSERRPLVLDADGLLFVGPDNGLFDVIVGRARCCRCWEIVWRPEGLSSTFHGRDLFAPIAAALCNQGPDDDPRLRSIDVPRPRGPLRLDEVVYIDRFGNAMTGIPAAEVDVASVLSVGSAELRHARTFASARPGVVFWYANSLGLVEIATNGSSASAQLGLAIGSEVVLRHL